MINGVFRASRAAPTAMLRWRLGQSRDRGGRLGHGNRVRRLGGREMSGKVVVNRSMSLDGFIAGPGDAMDWIFDFVAPDADWLTETAAATGAMLIGRRTDEVGSRMEAGQERGSASRSEGYPFSGPMFVLTHRPPDPPD